MKKRFYLLFVLAMLALTTLSSCGRAWTCDYCKKSWTGTAYYGISASETLCKDCARSYWAPFPIDGYKK